MSTEVEEYTVKELSTFDDDTGEEQLRFTTENDRRYPIRFQGFDEGKKNALIDLELTSSEVRELRDFLNSLYLD